MSLRLGSPYLAAGTSQMISPLLYEDSLQGYA